MASTSSSRVWVYLRKGVENKPQLAKFIQSILDFFGYHEHIGEVSCVLDDNKLIISDSGENRVTIKRPMSCPIHCIKSDQISAVPESVLQRGVDVVVCTLLRTNDRKTLLARRAQDLRIFPGVWAPPGGHVELGESLIEAAFRELHEETGLLLNPEVCPSKMIGLWECVYPPFLSRGLPTRHYIVVYMSTSVDQCHDDLDKNIHLQRSEVEASAWLGEMTVQAIVATDGESTLNANEYNLPESFIATVLGNDLKQHHKELDTSIFFAKAPLSGKDIESVLPLTKFGLSQWLKFNNNITS
ncbi:m7GpppN-mRNA hydrolase NUDT17-like [Saccoglossus kowalevskii]|uniref:m7GpppN-mRNA hydrolase NUDT17 n=1 Tax=Saccoglossus kowalevskii TaxID=10224 RepID=A0ABM0GYX7_SACKO|nr:PREDICTED: nucleoside diphosphate-linked moiety X motif 17-like [Saccoglossus kowalevskii]